MNEPEGHYAKRNKPDTERQILYDLAYTQNLKESQTHRSREQNGGCQGLGSWVKWRDVSQTVQTFSYKINNFWGSNVQHGDYH